MARGETASIKDLFSGSSHLLNLYLVNLIQNVGLTFASCFCLIPGLFLLPIFWAVPYVLIAERPPGIDAISRAIDYTRGNRLQILLIILVSMLIHFAGVCFCLGGLITFPLISMLTAVAYLRMTGQPTAEG
ncbi:MAG: hypothetical protein C0478_18955 [Planctomyces sp.]|nr:hypothetical protein [Planctomyces sp.]